MGANKPVTPCDYEKFNAMANKRAYDNQGPAGQAFPMMGPSVTTTAAVPGTMSYSAASLSNASSVRVS